MIQHGAQRIINATDSLLIDDDIDAILQRGESRTAELNAKYGALNFDDLANFKSENAGVTNWEGQVFGGRKKNNLLIIEPAKRERKGNYSIDSYYRDAMQIKQRGPGSRGPRGPRAALCVRRPGTSLTFDLTTRTVPTSSSFRLSCCGCTRRSSTL